MLCQRSCLPAGSLQQHTPMLGPSTLMTACCFTWGQCQRTPVAQQWLWWKYRVALACCDKLQSLLLWRLHTVVFQKQELVMHLCTRNVFKAFMLMSVLQPLSCGQTESMSVLAKSCVDQPQSGCTLQSICEAACPWHQIPCFHWCARNKEKYPFW